MESSRPADSGLHFDTGKPPVELVPPEAIYAMARVFGRVSDDLRKYPRHNWRGGIRRTGLLASALRHEYAWSQGEDLDPESGLPHLDHALTDLAMLVAEIENGKGEDDRWKG